MTVTHKLYQGQVLLKQFIRPGWFDRYQTVTSAAYVNEEVRSKRWS